MPKKYLIYVHNDAEFDKLTKRGEKSGLVNQLLDEHWKPKKKPAMPKVGSGKGLVDPKKVVAQYDAKKAIKTPEQAKAAARQVAKDRSDFCEHGFAPGFCKKQKCKNARRR